jgi:hypothetical protein
MSHLTEEQFEEILQGASVPDHVNDCSQCRARLAEKRALAKRLHKAFASVQANSELANRIRAQIGGAPARDEKKGPRKTIFLAVHRRLISGLAAAAAILLVAIPMGLYVSTGSEAHAAHLELVQLHQNNLRSMDQLFVHNDPNALADHLEKETGHCPAMISADPDVTVCGCCTGQFRGRKVGSYVVETPAGRISIMVLPDSPESLGMTRDKAQQPALRTMWHAACEDCNIAMVRIGDRSYCAVGEVPRKDLYKVLNTLPE